MPNPTARAGSTRAPSATTIMAVKPEASRHAAAPASGAPTAAAVLPTAAAVLPTAAAAGRAKRGLVIYGS